MREDIEIIKYNENNKFSLKYISDFTIIKVEI